MSHNSEALLQRSDFVKFLQDLASSPEAFRHYDPRHREQIVQLFSSENFTSPESQGLPPKFTPSGEKMTDLNHRASIATMASTPHRRSVASEKSFATYLEDQNNSPCFEHVREDKNIRPQADLGSLRCSLASLEAQQQLRPRLSHSSLSIDPSCDSPPNTNCFTDAQKVSSRSCMQYCEPQSTKIMPATPNNKSNVPIRRQQRRLASASEGQSQIQKQTMQTISCEACQSPLTPCSNQFSPEMTGGISQSVQGVLDPRSPVSAPPVCMSSPSDTQSPHDQTPLSLSPMSSNCAPIPCGLAHSNASILASPFTCTEKKKDIDEPSPVMHGHFLEYPQCQSKPSMPSIQNKSEVSCLGKANCHQNYDCDRVVPTGNLCRNPSRRTERPQNEAPTAFPSLTSDVNTSGLLQVRLLEQEEIASRELEMHEEAARGREQMLLRRILELQSKVSHLVQIGAVRKPF
eukprot:Filipodium_phascolosomae@DN2566_c0_g1_i14.p1